MTLLWTFNRLHAMSLPEIAHRVCEQTRKITARNRLEGWARYENKGIAPVLPGLRDYVSAFNETTRERIACTTADIVSGRFSALGRDWPCRAPDNLFPAELWRIDPVTGKLWPGAEHYCFDIPYRHERELGDVKYVWEINRLQFLHPLAAQVFFTGDVRTLAAIEDCIDSWHVANPPFRGLGWNSGIEIALRAISLLTVASLAGDRLKPKIIAKIRSLLSASLFWLARYPSRFSSANNHFIAETAGEFLISLAMPELPDAQAIHAKARHILEEEIQKQFHADGVPAEQSPTYGAFSAELLLLCHAVSPLGSHACARLHRFADFIFWLADGRGRIPAIGDDDEGRVLCFAPTRTYAFDIACRITPRERPHGVRIFGDGGYSVIRDSRWHVVFDHGPLGYLSIAAHGHADALSLCVSLDGEPLFVDPGTYLYHSGREERDWFRGTPAHNTLNIEGTNQSTISGPFSWSHKAQSRLEDVREGADWRITASHDGYQRRFGVRHQRTISGSQNRLFIEDRLLKTGRDAEIVFQLSPGLDAELKGMECCVARAGNELAAIVFKTPGRAILQESAVSPAFGVKLKAPRILWRGRVDERGAKTHIFAKSGSS